MAQNDWCGASCPGDCATLLIVPPVINCEKLNNDRITELFFSGLPLASGLLTEWNSRFSNVSTATDNTIRSLKMEGDLPRVEAAFKTSRKGGALPLETDKVVTFIYEDDSDPSFNYFKTMQCGMSKLFWLRSGAHIYGGLSGIYGTLVASYEINGDSDAMAHNWLIQIRFRSKCFPDRTAAVI